MYVCIPIPVVKAHPTRYRIKGEEAKKRASIGGVSFVSGD